MSPSIGSNSTFDVSADWVTNPEDAASIPHMPVLLVGRDNFDRSEILEPGSFNTV